MALGLSITALLGLSAIFADFLSPYPADARVAEQLLPPPQASSPERPPLAIPPVRLHLFKEGRLQLNVCRQEWQSLLVIRNRLPVTVWQVREDCSQRYPLRLFERNPHYRYKLFGLFETDLHLLGSPEAQAPLFLLGTDSQGRDLLSRILMGSRISLGISTIAVLLGLALALPLGAFSGYFGGRVDTVIQRVVEGTLAFPRLALLLVVASTFREAEERLLWMIIFLALVGWAPLARMLRAQALMLREEGFIEAAHALGAGHVHILRRHILPLLASTIIVSATLTLPNLLMLESFLSYLGYGVPETLPSWGLLLNELREVHLLPSKPWLLFAGVAIALTALACTILGESLQARFNPFKRVMPT
jgi:peptide/nickel transport system permease protein